MQRREFISLLGGAAATWPLTARAQRPSGTRLIAVVLAFEQNDQDGQRFVGKFREALQQLGWTPGDNLKMEFRWGAIDAERARAFAAEVINLKPDLIVTHATIVTRAMVQQSRTIPIVFTNVSDPIGEQFIQSFAHPGGNVTGFTNVEPSMGGKYLQLLKEIAPNVTRAAMIFNPKSAPGGGSYFYGPFKAAASTLSVQPIEGAVQDTADIDNIFATMARSNGGGLVVIGEPFTNLHRAKILELSAQYHVPTICPYRFYAQSGCLISYGVDFVDQFRRAATYVDRILKGEIPANLPAQSPVKFELVINLKIAKTLGLEIHPQLLASADEVIE